MVIYADEIFLINFVAAYILLYALGAFINKIKIKKKRLIAASAINGIASVVIFTAEMPLYISHSLRVLSVFLVMSISFFELRRQILKQIIWFLFLSGIITFSMIFILSVFEGTVGMMIKAGIVYFSIPPVIFVITLVISYVIMFLFIKMFKNRKNKRYYILTLTHNDKSITLTALFDSGNLLREPITGKYVTIVEWEKVKELLGADYEFSALENYMEELKLWAVPFRAFGKSEGIIFAFMADKLTIHEEKRTEEKVFIGIYEKPLSSGREYSALLSADMI